MTASAPCLAAFFSISFLLLITVWVTPENQLAELALRGSSVLPQDFRGPQMGVVSQTVGRAQTACISRLVDNSKCVKAVVIGGGVPIKQRCLWFALPLL